MHFETGDVYHIYNQGNDRVRLFYSRENYIHFLDKIKLHVLPHADLLAWCLMPNHFHLMAYVHSLEIEIQEKSKQQPLILPADFQQDVAGNNAIPKIRDLNNSIGIMLRSYTRAIQEQEDKTGSLFRKSTKANCLTQPDLHTPSFFKTLYGTVINQHFPEEEYPQVCFDYIHNNPVKAGLVKHPEDWEFSSFRDYNGMRNGKMINRGRTEEFGLFIR